MGFFLAGLSWSAAAQTPVPQTPTKEPAAATPTIPPAPVVPVTESGQQLVRKADALIKTPGNTLQALALYETAAQAFHQSGEAEAEALAWHRIAQLNAQAGYRHQAQAAAEKARTLLRVRTLPTRVLAGLATAQAARAYLTLGRIHHESGEVKEAMDSYQAGLQLATQAKLHRETAAGHVALGFIASQAEEWNIAIRMTLNSLDFWRAAKDFSGESVALNNLARYYERKGDLQLAAEFDEQAVQVTRFSRNYKAEDQSLTEAMRVQMILSNYEEAAWACEQLIGLARLSGDRLKESQRLMILALLDAQRDQWISAYQVVLKALIIGAESNEGETIARIKTLLGQLDAVPRANAQQKGREQLLAEAEFESGRGDFSAAYQLLLRALLMNEGKSDVLNAPLNMRIKTLAKQIEAQEKKNSRQ
ncbi:MAG TPA: hypothetical protein VFZ34_23625 [Blastocatellia bacterium]|nr:hypothetical protein [Blastocatellia bacterium]